MARFQENMKKLREDPTTSRAGLKWDDSDDETVIKLFKNNNSIDIIAKNLKRTSNSIKTRIIMHCIKLIEDNNADKDDTLKEFKVSNEEYNEYVNKKKERGDQQKNYINSIVSKTIYNPTIRDNYQLLKEILNRLNAIEEKINL